MFDPIAIDRLDRLPEGLAERLLPAAAAIPPEIDRRVADIIARVRAEGDRALSDYSERFDGVRVEPGSFRVTPAQLEALAARVESEVGRAIRGMIDRVRRFHERQRRTGYTVEEADGTRLSWRLRPVAAAAVYVPGGLAAYPSTVVMNVVPAQLAGVPRIAALTPPGTLERNPAVAYALATLGVAEVLRLGGAQAIAAAAFGTATIRPVDLIVGPGNAYVAAAKRQVFGRVGIDSVAGPSEVAILADDSAPAEWVARDLLAQAEHDELARCFLVTPSRALAAAVAGALEPLLEAAPRVAIARRALEDRGANCVVPDLATGVALVNAIAPEHLQVMLAEDASVTAEDLVAGAIFWGADSPTAVGDYWAGPNHVLPTGGTARFRGPLGVDDFLVPTTLVRYGREAARSGLQLAQILAEAEGLWAHAASLACRGAAEAAGTDPAAHASPPASHRGPASEEAE